MNNTGANKNWKTFRDTVGFQLYARLCRPRVSSARCGPLLTVLPVLPRSEKHPHGKAPRWQLGQPARAARLVLSEPRALQEFNSRILHGIKLNFSLNKTPRNACTLTCSMLPGLRQLPPSPGVMVNADVGQKTAAVLAI